MPQAIGLRDSRDAPGLPQVLRCHHPLYIPDQGAIGFDQSYCDRITAPLLHRHTFSLVHGVDIRPINIDRRVCDHLYVATVAPVSRLAQFDRRHVLRLALE